MSERNLATSNRARCAAFAGLLLPLFALTADTITGLCAGWRPAGSIEHAAMCLLGGYGLAMTGLFFWKPARRWLFSHGADWVLLAAALCLGWGLLEWGAGILEARMRFKPDFHTRGPNLRRTFIPDPDYLPGMLEKAHFTTGPEGLRAPYPPEARHTCRILCVGGSTTECVYLDDTASWPGRLMHELNTALGEESIWVGNAGISGFDTHEHLLFMERSPLLENIACVIIQPGINDLWRYLAKEENQIKYDRFAVNSASPPMPGANPAKTPWRPLWVRSRVIQFYHTFQHLREQKKNEPPPRAETVEGIGGQEYRIRREKREQARIVDELPDLSPGLRSYGERIRTIIQLGRKRNVRVAFTSQPVLWQADLPPEAERRCWLGWLENGDYLSIAALRNAMDAYNETLKTVCAETDTPCIDLSEMNGKLAYFYDDCHFTPEGAAEVARRIANQIGPWVCAPPARKAREK